MHDFQGMCINNMLILVMIFLDLEKNIHRQVCIDLDNGCLETDMIWVYYKAYINNSQKHLYNIEIHSLTVKRAENNYNQQSPQHNTVDLLFVHCVINI